MPRSNSAAEDTAAATEAPYASTSKPRNHRRRRRRPHNPPPPLAAPPAAIADSSLVPATLQAWGSSGWTTSRSNSTQHLPATLHLLTYNIWSSSLSHTPSQDLALLRILSSSPADIIALQELSQSFYSTLLRQSWLQRDWLVTDWQAFRDAGDLELPPPTRDGKRPPKGKPGEEEAVVLLVKRKLWTEGSTASFLPLPRATADQPKAAILLHLRDATGSEVYVATSHFTSLPMHSTLRLTQTSHLLAHLPPPSPTCTTFLLLDTNTTTPSTELAPLLSSSFIDVAAYLKCEKPTFGTLYPFLSFGPGKGGRKRKARRVDRVYVRGESATVEACKIVGNEPVRMEVSGVLGQRVRDTTGEGKGGWEWPSDHLGVEVRVKIR